VTSLAVDAPDRAQVSTEPGADEPRPRGASELLPRRPYPGLRPFKRAEWPIFCGRERLIQDVLTLLARSHFASVIGPSGSGKSSLVKAGVLATLERRHSRMGVRWRTGTMRPGASPLWSMADGILRALRPELVGQDGELPASEVARLRVLIDTSDDGLAVVTQEFGCDESENFLLLVDQFEEIFRYKSPEENQERARLIELLLAVARDQPPGLYIITTMRSEYLGECARFSGLAETLNETHYLLPRMTEEELRQAIVEPARLKNGTIEDELVERLIKDIRSQEDQLPILQHTLLWMWIQEEEKRERARPGGAEPIHLGLDDYEQLEPGRNAGETNRVKNALSRHGDTILDGLSPEERKAAEVMFRRMVEVEEGLNKLRRPTRCGTVAKLAEVSLEVVQRVVDAFRAEDASFIHANQLRITDDTSIDIMHESLIRQWDTLDRWVRREKASYEVYDELCRAAQRRQEGRRTLFSGLELSRALLWASREQPTRLWARRYDGDFDAAIGFLSDSEEAEEQRRRAQEEAEQAEHRREEERLRLENERLRLEEEQSRLLAEKSRLEQQALTARLEKQTRLAGERRRFTRFAAAAAVIAGVLATAAGTGFWQAREAVIETKAGAFWYRLQLWGDPLRAEDVTTLWDLARADDQVRVAFVRQMTNDRQLLRRFGIKPQPIARAVGLRWPDEARQIAKQSVAHVASDQFDPGTADRFELIAYTRALAALQPWLDPALADAATKKLADAINALAGGPQLSDRRLWALAETVAVFSGRLDPAAIEMARERLRREIMATDATDDSGRRARAISRAVEIMAPVLTPEERLQAVRYLVPRLGQDIDSWAAAATPRALLALVPTLDASQADAMLSAVPPAIARVAVESGDRDSSYPLALMRLAEALAGHDKLGAAFSQALTKQFALPNDPLQHAALARATVPLLARLGDGAEVLVPTIAAITLVPEGIGDDLDASQRSFLRQKALEEGHAAVEQALASLGGEPGEGQAESALQILHGDWSTQPIRSNPYRRAAQARLLALLAPSLPPESAALASTDLLQMLPGAADHLTREAIARALAALARNLPDAERQAALADAKAALAKTGSTEEATAWADAIAALLPAEPRAATAEIVEALKYPTATEAPTNILLAALAKPWPEEHKAIAGRTLPDPMVMDWLEAHLPDGHSLTSPPPRPVGLHAGNASPDVD